MTVPATTRRAGPFTGNGTTTSFPFTFKVFTTADLAVQSTVLGITSTLVAGSDYNITLNPDQESAPGGTIVLTSPLAEGAKLVAVGSVPYDQTTDFPAGGAYRAQTHENAFDRTVFQIQQLAEESSRALTLPPTSGADGELPNPDPNKVLGWNETGTGLTNLDPSVLASIVAFGTARADIFSGTGSQTTFTLSSDPGVVANLDVSISGVTQLPGVDYTWSSGTTLTFTSAPPSGTNNILVRYIQALPQTGGLVIPSLAGQTGKYLTNNGADLQWSAVAGGGGNGVRHVFNGSGELGDDTAALAAFYAAVPLGGVMEIRGLARVTSTITFNRRVSVVTPGNNDAIIVAVGTGSDGVVFSQGTANDELGTPTAGGINGIVINLHVYGRTGACLNAVVLRRVDRSRIYLNVRAGAVGYGVVVEGCLINRIHIESTINYAPPISLPGSQVDHVLLKKNTTYNVATNINQFWVNLEGCRKGIVTEAMPGEGGNVISGVIEGLTGKCFEVAECEGMHITDFWAEANEGDSTFNTCRNLRIGPGVNCYDGLGRSDDWIFTNQRGLCIDGYYGGYNIQSTCTGTTIGQVGTPDYKRNLCTDVSAVQRGWMADASYPTVQLGVQGDSPMENVFPNPYMDLWAEAGVNAAPVGTTAPTGATVGRFVSPRYPSNGVVYSCRMLTSAAGIDHGLFLRPGFGTANENGYLSVFIPVYVPNGNPGVRVWIFDGSAYNLIFENTTTKDTWFEVRGSAKMISGNDIAVVVSAWDGSTYPSGARVFIGGCSMVNGPIPPKHLADHGKRLQRVINNISNTPDFVGQRATSGGALYMAVSNGAPSDWLKISP